MSKLSRLRQEKVELLAELEELRQQSGALEKKRQKIGKRLKSIGNAIYDLLHDGDTPHITDHAIVRYLERVEKMDISELKVKVANHEDAVRDGNVVLTVNDPNYFDDEAKPDIKGREET